MEEQNSSLSFASKLRSARKKAGLTQEALAEKLLVSRQAVAKWEADKGMPDIENLKRLSAILDVSLDHLLMSGESIDLSVTRESICLSDYMYDRKRSGRWVKKAAQKDMVVLEKYHGSDIHTLVAKQIPSKAERITDNVLAFFFGAPFGIPDFINGLRHLDKEFYLVRKAEQQYLVIVTDEYIESRRLSQPITQKKFSIGNFVFQDCGSLKGCCHP